MIIEVERIKKYFSLGELVSPNVLKRYGEQAWSFFDPRLFDVLVWLREGLGIGLVCNTKTQVQRGFRENTCDMVSGYTKQGKMYCSSHCLGRGVDLSAINNVMSAEKMRQWVRSNIDTCPWPIRMEKAVNWLHIDTMNATDSKLVEFSA